MKVLKDKVGQAILLHAPLSYLERRHHYKTRRAVKPWLHDDFLFIHVPKSGGTSVAKGYGREESGHYTYSQLIKLRGCRPEGAYFVMRNPIDRVVSSYKYLLQLHDNFGSSPIPAVVESKDINEFLESYFFSFDIEKHYFFKSATSFIRFSPPEKTWMVNFNDLGTNLKLFGGEVLKKELNIPHLNSSSESEYKSDISNDNLERLKKLYEDDLKLLRFLSGRPYVLLSDRKK